MPMNQHKLYRSEDSVIFGVCGGLAEHFDLSPWGVRLVWVLLTFVGGPFMVFAYIALALAMKRRPYELRYGGEQGGTRRDWRECPDSHSVLLERVQRRFESLDKRLQRMESIVTRPTWDLEQKYREL